MLLAPIAPLTLYMTSLFRHQDANWLLPGQTDSDFMVSIGVWGWSTLSLNTALLEGAQRKDKDTAVLAFSLLFLLVFCTALFIRIKNP